jgi:chorismate dehydratase
MTKIVMVSYLNTIPFLKGLETDILGLFEVDKRPPSVCAEVFKRGEADIALLPVATLYELPPHRIITDYCIGCEGSVRTVIIASNSPIKDINTLYLDKDSRSSIQLARILLQEHYGLDVVYKSGLPEYSDIKINEAVLLIGDKVFEAESEFAYKIDLGEVWGNMTGLPFTFAVWVADESVDQQTIHALNSLLKVGIEAIPFTKFDSAGQFDLDTYFSKYISYDFDEDKRRALDLFLNKISKRIIA